MNKTKVLVVSSDAVMQDLLRQNLNVKDYELALRQDIGDQLRTDIEDETPHLIILDVMMPGLGGIEVCLRVRQWCLTPIMMLSTWGAGEGKVRGLNLGAESYLTESFGATELEARIKELLRRNAVVARQLSNIRSGVSWER